MRRGREEKERGPRIGSLSLLSRLPSLPLHHHHHPCPAYPDVLFLSIARCILAPFLSGYDFICTHVDYFLCPPKLALRSPHVYLFSSFLFRCVDSV